MKDRFNADLTSRVRENKEGTRNRVKAVEMTRPLGLNQGEDSDRIQVSRGKLSVPLVDSADNSAFSTASAVI